jgi:ribosomal-protein-serine acetyltransferase
MFTRSIGNGIELRLLDEGHAADLFAAVDRNRERLRRWLGWVEHTRSVEDCRSFARAARLQFDAREALHVGIWDNERLIGGAGCRTIDWANRSTSIGYWLEAAAEGRGIATRCCEALLDHFFGELRLRRVEIRCATGNTRSCAIPARLGFTREGVLRQAEWINDHFDDLVLWSILDEEWRCR